MSEERTQNPFSPELEAALDEAVAPKTQAGAPVDRAKLPAHLAAAAAQHAPLPGTAGSSLAASVKAAEAAPGPEAPAGGTPPLLESTIVDAIKTVYDPEIPVNVYEIGLIYNIDIQPGGRVEVKMTLTSPGCPSAQEIPVEVKERVESVAGVTACDVEIVWDPTWNPSMMSEAARLQLGFF